MEMWSSLCACKCFATPATQPAPSRFKPSPPQSRKVESSKPAAQIAVTLTPGLRDVEHVTGYTPPEDKPTVNILEQAQQQAGPCACRKFELFDPSAECDCAQCVADAAARSKKEAKKKKGFFFSGKSDLGDKPQAMTIGSPTNVQHVTHVNVSSRSGEL